MALDRVPPRARTHTQAKQAEQPEQAKPAPKPEATGSRMRLSRGLPDADGANGNGDLVRNPVVPSATRRAELRAVEALMRHRQSGNVQSTAVHVERPGRRKSASSAKTTGRRIRLSRGLLGAYAPNGDGDSGANPVVVPATGEAELRAVEALVRHRQSGNVQRTPVDVVVEGAGGQRMSASEALKRLGQLDGEGRVVEGSYAHTLQRLASGDDDAGWNAFFATVYPEYDPAQFAEGADPSATLRARLAQGDFSLLPDVLFVNPEEEGFDLQGRDGVFFSGDPDNADARLHKPLLVLNAHASPEAQLQAFSNELGHGLERWFLPEGVEDSEGDEGARLGVALRGLTPFAHEEGHDAVGIPGPVVNTALDAPVPAFGGGISLSAAIEQAGEVRDGGEALLFGQWRPVETDTPPGVSAPDRLATSDEVAHLFGLTEAGPNRLGRLMRFQRTHAEARRGTLFTPDFAARPGSQSTSEQVAAVEAAYLAIEDLFHDPVTGQHRLPTAQDIEAFLAGLGGNVRFVVTDDLPGAVAPGVGVAPIWSQQDADDPGILNIYVHTSVLDSSDPSIGSALIHQIGEYLHFVQAGPEAYAEELEAHNNLRQRRYDVAYGALFAEHFLRFDTPTNPFASGFDTGAFSRFHPERHAVPTTDTIDFRGRLASAGFEIGALHLDRPQEGGEERLPPTFASAGDSGNLYQPGTELGRLIYEQLLAGATRPLFLGQASLSAVAQAVDALPEYYGELLLEVLEHTPNVLDGILGGNEPDSLRTRLNRGALSVEEGAQLILGALANLTQSATPEDQAAALHRLVSRGLASSDIPYDGQASLTTSYIVNYFLPAGRDFDVAAWAAEELSVPDDPALKDALHKSYLAFAQQHPNFDINDENWLSKLHNAVRSDLWLNTTAHPITDKHREFHFVFDEGVRTALSVARWVLDPEAGPGLEVEFTKPNGESKVLTSGDFDSPEFLDNPLLVAAAGLEVLAAYKEWEQNAPTRYDDQGNLARTPLEIIMGREAANNSWVLNTDAGQFLGSEISLDDLRKNFPGSGENVTKYGPFAPVVDFFGLGTGSPKQTFGALIDQVFGGKISVEFKNHDTSQVSDADVAGDFAARIMNVGEDITTLLPRLSENIATAYSQLPELLENGAHEDEVKTGLFLATSLLGIALGPLGLLADTAEFAAAVGFAALDKERRDSLFNSMLEPVREAGRDTGWIDWNKKQSHERFRSDVGEAAAWYAGDLAAPGIAGAVVAAVKSSRAAVKSAKHVTSSPNALVRLADSAGKIASEADAAKALGKTDGLAEGGSAIPRGTSPLDDADKAADVAEGQGLGKQAILKRADDAAVSATDGSTAGEKAAKGPVARKLAELREGATGQAKEIFKRINPKTEEGLDTAARVLGAVAVRATFEAIEFVLYDDTSLEVPWANLETFLSAVIELDGYLETVEGLVEGVQSGSEAVKELFDGSLDGLLNTMGKTLPPGIDPWTALLLMAQHATSEIGDAEGAEFLDKALANAEPTKFESAPITGPQWGDLLGQLVAGREGQPVSIKDLLLSLPAGQVNDIVQGLLEALPADGRPADMQNNPVDAHWSSVLKAIETGDLSHLEDAGLRIERVAETSNPPAYFAPMGDDGEVDYSGNGKPTIFLAENASGADLMEELFEWLAFTAMGPKAAKQMLYGPYDDEGVPVSDGPDIDIDAGKAIAFVAESLARGEPLDEDLFLTALSLPAVQASDRVPFFGGFATGALNPVKALGRVNRKYGSTRNKAVAGLAAGTGLASAGLSQLLDGHAAVGYKSEGFAILVTGYNPQFADNFHDPNTGQDFTRGFEANFQLIWPFIGGGSPEGRARFNKFVNERKPGTLGEDDEGGYDLTILPGMRVTIGNSAIATKISDSDSKVLLDGGAVGAVHLDFVGAVIIHMDHEGNRMDTTHADTSVIIRFEGILINGFSLAEIIKKITGSVSSVFRRKKEKTEGEEEPITEEGFPGPGGSRRGSKKHLVSGIGSEEGASSLEPAGRSRSTLDMGADSSRSFGGADSSRSLGGAGSSRSLGGAGSSKSLGGAGSSKSLAPHREVPEEDEEDSEPEVAVVVGGSDEAFAERFGKREPAPKEGPPPAGEGAGPAPETPRSETPPPPQDAATSGEGPNGDAVSRDGGG